VIGQVKLVLACQSAGMRNSLALLLITRAASGAARRAR